MTLRSLQAWDGVDFHISHLMWFRYFCFCIFLSLHLSLYMTNQYPSSLCPGIQNCMRRVRRWGSSPGNILLQPEPKKMGAVTSCKYTEVCQVTKSVKRDFFLGSGWSDIDRGQILIWSERERSSQTSRRAHGVQERGIGSRELKGATLDQGTFHSSQTLRRV